jgi:tRNA dimethylallyltransferase
VISIRDRHSLHKAIERRFSLMLERGFVGEVERLRARGDLSLDKPAMRSVGYRQIWDYLEGHSDYSRMVHRGVVATRQLAKRQLTWLRSEASAECLDNKHPGRLGRALELLRAARFFRASA